MPFDPGRPRKKQPEDKGAKSDRGVGRRDRGPRLGDPDESGQCDKGQERPLPDSVPLGGRAKIEPETGSKQAGLDENRTGYRVPKSEADKWTRRPQRQIGTVGEGVQEPVAQDKAPEHGPRPP